MAEYYVYLLLTPDEKPFYVGKGQKQRVFAHTQEARIGHRCYKCNLIRKLWRQGLNYTYSIVFITNDETVAFKHERMLIVQYGRENLCNLTDGGEGCSGRSVSNETRQKLSRRFKGRIGTRLGHTNTTAHRQKISAAKMGHSVSIETRNKIRERKMGKSTMSLMARQRMSDRMQGNTYGRNNQNVWNKGKQLPEAIRLQISKTLKEKQPWKDKKHTEATKEKMRDSANARYTVLDTVFIATDTNGIEYPINNLRTFCTEHTLIYSSFQNALRRNTKHRGWSLKRIR